MNNIIKELKVNTSLTAKFFILNFRLASLYYTAGLKGKIFIINIILLKIIKLITGIDIPAKTKIGYGLVIYHPQNIVINQDSILGNNIVLKHNVTIGNKKDPATGKLVSPIIGNNVEFNPGVVVAGDVSIGDNCILGAGTIVVKTIPENSIAVGNPARVIKKR